MLAAPGLGYQSTAAPSMPATMPMKNSGLAAALSPALEAALVDDGWMSASMLVIIPPRPSPS
jgi:hypothetical protein